MSMRARVQTQEKVRRSRPGVDILKILSLLSTMITEFSARGLVWVRVLVVGFLMPEESYGFLILLVSGEALFGAVISYPQIKDLLLNQKARLVELSRTVVLFLLTAPVMIFATYWYFDDILTTAVVMIAALLFALTQVLLYMLRVTEIGYYNRAKATSAILSTIVFLVILPRHPLLLPVVSAAHAAVLLIFFVRRFDSRWSVAWSSVSVSHSLHGWLIFGFQAAVFNLAQYGSRFVIGSSLSIVDVATFTRTYMIVGGISFYYAAIMVLVEKDLSKRISRASLIPRLGQAASAFFFLLVGSVFYFAGLLWVISARPFSGFEGLIDLIRPDLFLWLALLFVVQAVFLCINPVVISLGRRTSSLASSVVSLATQVMLLIFYWDDLSMVKIAIFMLAGQLVGVIYLLAVGLTPGKRPL